MTESCDLAPTVKPLPTDNKTFDYLLESALKNPIRKLRSFNVLFAGLDKAPRLPWEKWQSQAQSDEDVRTYFSGMGAQNVTCWGFVTGYNGLVAIDFDWSWIYRLWKKRFGERAETLTVQTPNGGLRPHYICEKPETVDKFKHSLHVELKGSGRFVVYEGHASREDGSIGEYKVVADKPIREDDNIVVDTMAWLEETQRRYHFLRWNCIRPHFSKKVLGEPSHELRLYISDIMAYEGFNLDEMHNLFRDFSDYNYKETDAQLKYTLDRVKAGLKPPSCETLSKTLGWNPEACAGCERREHQKYVEKVKVEDEETTATVDKVIQLAQEGIVKLLHDPSDGSYAVVKGSRHQETHAIKSGSFQRWLREKYFQAERRGLRREVIADAVATLEAIAEFGDNKEKARLHNRVAIHDGAIYYDLANPEWQAVKITAEGWTVIDNPPPLFRRFQHQQPQVLPERGGTLDDLFTFINVKDADSQLLIKVNLVVALIYGIPHPILLIIGPQGCGKSLAMQLMRMLIDPSRIPKLSFNYDRHETALLLHQHYAAFFDNVSTIPDWLSDILCRACTGDGFTKRQLYTDQDAIILEFKRWIGINGIDVTPEKPDLMDRAIILRLSPIVPENRKQEKQILEEFDKKRPKIFGAILDALSKAIRIFPTIDTKSLPRMADFAKWGEAVARALGYEPNAFLKAYEKILGEQTLAVLEVNPVGMAIIKFMENRESWRGTPTELLDALEAIAEEHKLDTRSKKWPKTAVWLTRRMRMIENDLRARGLIVDFGLSGDRVITIQENDGGGKSGKGGISPTLDTTLQHAESHVNGQKSTIGPTQQASGNTANTAVTASMGPRYLDASKGLPSTCWICHGLLGGIYEKTPDGPAHPNCWQQLQEGLKQQSNRDHE